MGSKLNEESANTATLPLIVSTVDHEALHAQQRTSPFGRQLALHVSSDLGDAEWRSSGPLVRAPAIAAWRGHCGVVGLVGSTVPVAICSTTLRVPPLPDRVATVLSRSTSKEYGVPSTLALLCAHCRIERISARSFPAWPSVTLSGDRISDCCISGG